MSSGNRQETSRRDNPQPRRTSSSCDTIVISHAAEDNEFTRWLPYNWPAVDIESGLT